MTHCVCYISDQKYLLPTFLSAQQARSHTSRAIDVLIYVANADQRALGAFGAAARKEGIILLPMPEEIVDTIRHSLGHKDDHFSGRIPPLSAARLLLHRFLPQRYTDFLYIDGDTQICAGLDPLAGCTMPEGKFYGARDYGAIMACAGIVSPEFRAHTARLGLSEERALNYVNSGVLRSSTRTWTDIGERTFEFFVRRSDLCHPYHEQGALNGAAGDAHVLISSRWNSPRQLMPLLKTPYSNAAIVHYMACPKPWQGTFYPWRRDEHLAYLGLVRRHPEIADYLYGLSHFHFAGYKARSMRTRILELMRTQRPEIDGPMAQGVI